MATASVIVRARDEAASIGRTLDLLAGQTLVPEVIVVDSGSRDDTVEIARARGARIVEIAPERFTYGGALNAGCEVASGEALVALSAHAFPRNDEWLLHLVEVLASEHVACACGDFYDVEGEPLRTRRLQDIRLAHRNPLWGYSNAAGGFRAELWRKLPFRTDLPGAEDKAWAWHWMERGWLTAVDPDLTVDHDHSREGAVASFRRSEREWDGLARGLGLPAVGARELAVRWWREREGYTSAARARLSRRRWARLAGEWRGRRRGARAYAGAP
jgi:rhamnosyltransferase